MEVKQNTSLKTLFIQITKVIKDFKLFLPNEKYYYFGFINEMNSKNGLQKRK